MWNQKFKQTLVLLSLSCLPFTTISAPNESALWFTQTDIALDSRYQTVLLDNGLRVITVENSTPKQGLSIRMFVDAGSFQEKGKEPGLAHFLEHMAFNGSTHVPEGEMISMLERHGLAFGADTNATTSMTNTNYRLDLPKADIESINTALFLLRETASELTLDQGAIDRERKVIKSEVRERQSVGLDRFLDSSDYIYAGANLPNKIGLGTIKGMDQVTQKDLRSFYQTYYAPRNTTLVLAGDVSHDVMLERVKHFFSDWRNKEFQPAVDPEFNVVLPSKVEAKVFTDPNVETRIEFNFLEKESPEANSKALNLEYWTHLLSTRALINRIDTLAYESGGRILSPSMSSEISLESVRVSQIGVTTADRDWEFGLSTLEQKLRQAVEFGFTEDEIKKQLTALENQLQLSVETAGDSSSDTLANRVMNAVDSGYVIASPQTDLSIFYELRDQLTVKSINEAFRKRWASQPPRLYLTERSNAPGLEKTLLETYAESQQTKVTPYVEKAATEFAYQNFGKPGKAQLIGTSKYGHILRYRFDNGVMLNIKQTDFEKSVVYISARVGKGLMALTQEQSALINLYNVGMSTGGLKAHDINELKRIFAGTTMGLESTVETNAFVLKQAVKNEDALNQLRVFAALMIDGGYREQGKSFTLQMLSNYLETYQESPEEVQAVNIRSKLHGGDLRWVEPSMKELDAFSMSDLKPIMDNAISNGPVEIGIVGDISPQEAIDYVAQTFGALDIKANATIERYQVEFPAIKKEDVTWYHKGEKTTALASSYWDLPDARNTKQSLHFLLLENVIQQRVTREIREAIGAAYSPWSGRTQSYNFKNFGYLTINSNTTIAQVDKVFLAYKNVLKSLQSELITDDELKRAATPILDAVDQQVESNSYWFDLTSTAQTYPDIIEADGITAQELATATKEDILAAAKLIDVDNVLQVRVLPEKYIDQ
ncbi:insulinase family protein [Vibrio europaeus]|uniref:M16 family metallopeptidase n=2 Tax=Vibrio TaxID=662 RepID=UPI00233F64AE|nr:insulinase family protein [Vibrio europaeus]MDC5870318.1 insulinase family protein [Vibrio europaeus]